MRLIGITFSNNVTHEITIHKGSYAKLLPQEILQHVFSYLPIEEQLSTQLALTSYQFYIVGKNKRDKFQQNKSVILKMIKAIGKVELFEKVEFSYFDFSCLEDKSYQLDLFSQTTVSNKTINATISTFLPLSMMSDAFFLISGILKKIEDNLTSTSQTNYQLHLISKLHPDFQDFANMIVFILNKKPKTPF